MDLICSWLFPGVHILKQSVPRQYNVRKTQSFDPIPPVAKEISNEAWLLCFDEFQVLEFSLLSSRAHLHVHEFENENFKMNFSFECHHKLNFEYFNIVVPKNQNINLLYPFEIVKKCKLLKLGKHVSLFLFAKRCFLHPKVQFTEGGWQF